MLLSVILLTFEILSFHKYYVHAVDKHETVYIITCQSRSEVRCHFEA